MRLTELISENELKEIVLNEYKRKLIFYKMVNEKMKKKYSMNFEDFEEKNIVMKKNFSWDVEKDAIEWEHAVASIRYLEEKIKKIETITKCE